MTALQTASQLVVPALTTRQHTGSALAARLPAIEEYLSQQPRLPVSYRPGWLLVLQKAMGHTPYVLEALRGDRTVGVIYLAYVESRLFGRYLVSLPYLNSGGIITEDSDAAAALIGQAVRLANELQVRYLELRHEEAIEHPSLSDQRTDKVHMRLELPTTGAALWEQISAKARNQVRKGQKFGFTVHWGGQDLLDDFYAVFSRNMRDLGTPTFGRSLFAAILDQFPDAAEFCVLGDAGCPVAGALMLHGRGVTEVPSASSLKDYNPTCANMLLYWHLLERSAERRQEMFDFGRSSVDSSTFRFKKQWGAIPSSAEWQYFLREGNASDMRKDNPKYRRFIALWRKLPLGFARWLGPFIARGIP